MITTRICVQCGKEFVTDNGARKCCSVECSTARKHEYDKAKARDPKVMARKRAYSAEYRRRQSGDRIQTNPRITKVCRNCGRKFTDFKFPHMGAGGEFDCVEHRTCPDCRDNLRSRYAGVPEAWVAVGGHC